MGTLQFVTVGYDLTFVIVVYCLVVSFGGAFFTLHLPTHVKISPLGWVPTNVTELLYGVSKVLSPIMFPFLDL